MKTNQGKYLIIKILLIYTLILIVQSSFGQKFIDLYGDYLGQTPPGDTPMIFAPGIITGFVHGGMTISPEGDEIFWSVSPSYIYYSKLANGKWTEPALADFVQDFQAYQNEGSVFSPDGEKLYFSSNRPGGMGNTDIWFVERNKNGWGKPINMGREINTKEWDRFPFVSPDGKYLFFTRGGSNSSALFWVCAKIIDRLKEKSKIKNKS